MKYLVIVKAESAIVVEAEDEEHAEHVAFSECDLGCFVTTESRCHGELQEGSDLERTLRHCDQVIE